VFPEPGPDERELAVPTPILFTNYRIYDEVKIQDATVVKRGAEPEIVTPTSCTGLDATAPEATPGSISAQVPSAAVNAAMLASRT
jgi:hypothetical protein